MRYRSIGVLAVLGAIAGCEAAPANRLPAAKFDAPAVRWSPAPAREGGALARGAHDEALYIADEDHAALRVVPLPIGSGAIETVALPGRPANVLPLSDRVLVTVRDPGLLLSLVRREGALVVAQRVALPGDSWGLAVTPDERSAIVTSAWTHRTSAIDLASGAVRWSLDVAREPRGVVVTADGRAYVTHLTGSAITRIDDLDGAAKATRVSLPAGRFSASAPAGLDASLAYAPALSPDGARLFVPRHALGGVGWHTQWFGRPVVDVLVTSDDSPLAPLRNEDKVTEPILERHEGEPQAPILQMTWTTQPRASRYRRSNDTLLVASEGGGWLTELDARALDPSLHPVYRYDLIHGDDSERCGAPSGVALSADETTAYVWCRTTGELAAVALVAPGFTSGPDASPRRPTYLAIAGDSSEVAKGRKLFYDARSDGKDDWKLSQGLACAGCHPDGRDDGHVWFGSELLGGEQDLAREYPRHTPTLAGRVGAVGPYGWEGGEGTLPERILTGFAMHSWSRGKSQTKRPDYATNHSGDRSSHAQQAAALALFLREGLVPPPIERRPLTAVERRGKTLFESSETRCGDCHDPADGYSNRSIVTLDVTSYGPARDTSAFRVPSLLFAGATAPYFHDGRFRSLGELVDGIGDGMGHTSQLSSEDRAALAGYLATIGSVRDEVAVPEMVAMPLPVPERIDTAAAPALARGASSFALDPPSETATPAPTRKEWDAAPEIRLARMTDGCRAWRVREWLRVQCIPGTRSARADGMGMFPPELESVHRVALIAGARDGVELQIESRTGYSGEGVAIFPVRRGDRRLVEIDRTIPLAWGWRCFEWEPEATFTLSEAWLPGERSPEIAVTRYDRHPSTGVTIIGTCGF